MTDQTNRIRTPLSLIGIFITFTETVLGIGLTQTTGSVQIALTAFVIIFPIVIAGFFFFMLWKKPLHLYAPFEYGIAEDATVFIEAIKNNSEIVQTKADEILNIAKRLEELEIEMNTKFEESIELMHSIPLAMHGKQLGGIYPRNS